MIEVNALMAIGIVVVGSVIGHLISHAVSRYTSFEHWLDSQANRWL